MGTASRRDAEGPEVVHASTSKFDEEQLRQIFGYGRRSPGREGGSAVPGRVRFEEGLPRVVSQQALLVSNESPTAVKSPTVPSIKLDHVRDQPYTPSIYQEGVWSNDPRVVSTLCLSMTNWATADQKKGTILPPFSPVHARQSAGNEQAGTNGER